MKLELLHKLETKKMTTLEVITILNISERTLRRYIKKFREKGILSFQHGNEGRPPKNRSSLHVKEKVQSLVKELYYDFNMLHCLEKLKTEHGIEIKRETFRKWCHEINCVKRAKRKRSKPKYQRERMSRPGILLQMDGSTHRWFGEETSCLVATIDDANNDIPYAEFFEAETSLACLKVLKNIVQTRGVFHALYVDRAGVYGGIKRSGFSQVERALSEVGAKVIYAYSPEAKGRIERLFATFQDRLVPELRHKGIRTIQDANNYLHTVFLPHYKTKYLVESKNPASAYKDLPKKMNMKEIFCLKELRVISRDHTLSLDAQKYRIVGALKYSIYKQKIEIRTYLDGSWDAYFAGKRIHLAKIRAIKKIV